MIYAVANNYKDLQAITPDSFDALSVWERTHIQEWIRRNPTILGEELLIVAMEFDRFVNSSDRLDLLAIDLQGNMVVIELKRSPLAGTADLQAIRYAAMVSSMTIQTLVPYFVAYQKRYANRDLTAIEAETELRKFPNEEIGFRELSSRPRIILCSEGFSPEITTTVLWLNKSGLDLTCVQITPYKHNEAIFIVPKVVIPLQEAKQYLIEIRAKEEKIEQTGKVRRGRVMPFLLENGLIKGGEVIYLKFALPSWVRYDESDSRFRAKITGKMGRSDAVEWDYDGQEYSISGVTWKIFTDLHPEKAPYGGLSGADHWGTASGRSLTEIATSFNPQS